MLPTRYLSVSGARAGAVYLPLAELERRTHELPPPHHEVWVLGEAPEAHHALGWLHARGRRARLAPALPANADPNARYRLWEPNEWLQEVLSAPQHWQRALDLGCGSGREAVYLASLGGQVVAVDRLPEALERGRDLQRRYAPDSPPIQWACADLEHADWQPDGGFDSITLFYFLSRALIPRACAWLNPNGSLLIEAFTTTHRARYGKPAADARVVATDELPRLLPPEMRVVAYSEGWCANRRHTARLWAIRGEG